MSVNLEELVPVRTLRYGGQIDWDDPIQIPNGLAIVCQNMQFLAESVKMRWGMQFAMKWDGSFTLTMFFGDATGVEVLTVLGSPSPPTVNQKVGGASVSVNSLSPTELVGNNEAYWDPWTPPTESPGYQVSLVFTDTGELLLEDPAGSGALFLITEAISHFFTYRGRMAASVAALLPSGAYMLTAKAYNRIYQAFCTLAVNAASAFQVMALDAATGMESVVGQNPLGAAWQPDTFYQEGDIVTPVTLPTATSPYFSGYPTYFRRMATGYSGSTEPSWPTAFGYFTNTPSDYHAVPATADDGSIDDAWQEWNPGFPIYLPTPNPFSSVTQESGGTIGAGLDVYVCIAFKNDLGESAWTSPIVVEDTEADTKLVLNFPTGAGPYLPSWLMSVMQLGTTGGLHWPPSLCLNVYVASVTHGDAAPTEYYLMSPVQRPDTPITISAIPSGTTHPPRTQPTATVSTQPFAGEAGSRYAILLRQTTMGDLSAVDPRMAVPVSFQGALVAGGQYESTPVGDDVYGAYINVDDVTPFAPGVSVQITVNGGTYSATITGIFNAVTFGPNVSTFDQAQYPEGVIIFAGISSGPPSDVSTPVACTISIEASSCPVAVVPPGSTEYPTGYSYDILAFTVSGLGPDGPFNYLAAADPLNPVSVQITDESTDGNGNALIEVSSLAGLLPGANVLIAGWTGDQAVWNGLRVLATVAVAGSENVVTLPDPASEMSEPGSSSVTMSVVQTLPTQAVAGTVGILLQFDDTSLPEGVDVTGNLLFVAIPPCVDLAYIPSVDRMAYVSDLFPTSIIFSEESFMGEVDGENDVLSVDPANGAVLAGVREMLNGTIIAAKQNAGYLVVPTADVPANWGLNTLWGSVGPWSGKNIAKGSDGGRLDFFMFVDPERGLFKWPPTLGAGELDWLSKELSGANNQDASRMATWDRVNRAAGATIEVVVDSLAKEVKIAVPLDGATTPSHILTMNYFNGWQDPLMLTLSGEWVPNRLARRWNIDPIPTKCMALVKRTLATPVDQRVNYHQLLLGVPTYLADTYATIGTHTASQATDPTITPGSYYAQLAKVTGGQETAYSPVLGPFTVAVSGTGPYTLETFAATLPADGLEDSWTIYFGNTATTLTSKITGIPNTASTYVVSTAGASATQPVGFVALEYMEPGVYDDLGGGYDARYRPGYAKEAPSQEWPDGGRLCRFSAITGHALGAGNLLITPVTDDPNYQPDPMTVSLEGGTAQVPGSAPITHINNGFKGDSEFLSVEFSNGGQADNWFQLLFHTLWHKPLFPTR